MLIMWGDGGGGAAGIIITVALNEIKRELNSYRMCVFDHFFTFDTNSMLQFYGRRNLTDRPPTTNYYLPSSRVLESISLIK